MDDGKYSEKQQIEKATAEGFLVLYNEQFGTSYAVKAIADAPDVLCKDDACRELNLEITLTEDRPRDIQAALGRSNHRNLGVQPLGMGSSLSDEVTDNLVKRIQDKGLKRYGPNTALVIRDVSPVDWDWDWYMDDVVNSLSAEHNPFDRGVWIINLSKTRIFRVL